MKAGNLPHYLKQLGPILSFNFMLLLSLTLNEYCVLTSHRQPYSRIITIYLVSMQNL